MNFANNSNSNDEAYKTSGANHSFNISYGYEKAFGGSILYKAFGANR